jgi:hypothetical protein
VSGVEAQVLGAEVRYADVGQRCQKRELGAMEDPRSESEDGGAPQRCLCTDLRLGKDAPPSYIILLMVSDNAEEPRLFTSGVPSSQWKRVILSYNNPCEVLKHPKGD